MKYKISFRKPQKKKILIYYSDEENDIYLKKILKKKYHVYRGKYDVNLYIIFLTLLKSGLISFKKNYFINQIKLLSPKIVITLNDLNKKFYEIKNIDRKIKLISIQNGLRFHSHYSSFKKKIEVDYYLTFGKYFSKMISKYANAKFIEIGSFRNNSYKDNFVKKNSLLFISILKEQGKIEIPPGEVKILKYLERFCFKHNYKLNIFGRNKYDERKKILYRSILKKIEYNLIDHKKLYHSFYELYKKFGIFIIERSTTAYESPAFGKKTLILNFYNVNKKWYTKRNMIDNYPIDNSLHEGPFWSHDCSYEEFENKILKITNMSQKSWVKQSYPLIKNCMIYDKDNSKLKKFLNKF